MKLRTRRNSIRLRLTRREIAELAETGCVEETITLGPRAEDTLTYALVTRDGARELSARIEGRRIVVELATEAARSWAASEQVGLEAQQATFAEDASGASLSILVEKDFACLKPREGEDDDDAFPHPAASS